MYNFIQMFVLVTGRVVKRRDRATIGRRQLRTFRETEIESWLNGFRHKITTEIVTKSIPRFAHIFRGSSSLDTMRLIKLKVFVNYIYDHLVMTLPMIHLRPSGQAFANI